MARAVLDQLPHEPVLYLGDTARQPYGPKPIGEVREYALECLDHLVDQGVKALVIACNSASAAVLRDARERYPVPGRRGDPPRDPAGGRRHPHRPDRRDLHPGDRRLDGLRRRVHRRPARHAAHPGLPAVRRVRGGRGHQRPRADARRPRVPRPADRRRRRHPGARLHPLPAADRRAVLRDGRRRHAGVERGGDRQGRLPRCWSSTAWSATRRCPPPLHRFLTTGQPEEFAASVAGSSAPSWSPCTSSRRPPSGRPHEAHGRRLLGLVRRPATPRPAATSSRASTTAAPGGCCSTSAAAPSARCSASSTRSRSTRCCSPTCTPTTTSTSAGSTCMWKYHPDGARPPIPVWGPTGVGEQCARAYGLRKDPGMSAEFDFHEYDDAADAARPVHDHGRPGRAPDHRLRLAGRGRRGGAGLLRRHRPLPGARRPRRAGPTCCSPSRRSWSAGTTRSTCT